jgi:hypothetical protein
MGRAWEVALTLLVLLVCGAGLVVLALTVAEGLRSRAARPELEYAGVFDPLRPCALAALHPC